MSVLNVEIVTPSGILFNGVCNMAVVPSVEGDLGIMHGHEAVVAVLKEGVVKVYDEKQELVNSFDIVSGVAQIAEPGKLIVLLDDTKSA